MFFCERRILHKCCAFILIAAKIKVAGESRLKITCRLADYLFIEAMFSCSAQSLSWLFKKMADGRTGLCEPAALFFFF